jgi:hypothetical protein
VLKADDDVNSTALVLNESIRNDALTSDNIHARVEVLRTPCGIRALQRVAFERISLEALREDKGEAFLAVSVSEIEIF